MKLKSLDSFELLNDESIYVIMGGTVAESRKKDVSSAKGSDSYSKDHFHIKK